MHLICTYFGKKKEYNYLQMLTFLLHKNPRPIEIQVCTYVKIRIPRESNTPSDSPCECPWIFWNARILFKFYFKANPQS